MKKTKDETKKEAKAMTTEIIDSKTAATNFLEDLLSTVKGGECKHCADETAKNPLDKIAEGIVSAFDKAKVTGLPIKVEIGVGVPKCDCLDKAHDEEEADDSMDEDSPYDRLEKAIYSLSPEDTLYDMVSSDVEILNDTQIPELERTLYRLEDKLPFEVLSGTKAYLEALLNLREKAEKLLAKLDVFMGPDDEEEDEEE